MHYESVRGPGVWYGRDLAKRRDWIRHFSDAELAQIARAVRGAEGIAPEKLSPRNFPLPTLGPVLRGVAAELLEGRGFIVLRGLPVEQLTRKQQAIAYLGLDITNPNVRYYQTSRKLEYHTDSVDIVGLLCLKSAKAGGESYLASSMTVYNEVLARRPDLMPALFEPYPTDRRGEVPEGMDPWFDMPMFHWYAGKLSCIYVRQYIESAQKHFPEARRLTREQYAAMDLIDELCNDSGVHLSMDFRPGDIQLLHNHQVLHSRGDFENWPEPKRHRHLLRLWLAPREARALPEVFAARYGSVVPGERGGITVKGTTLKVPLEAE